MTLPSWRDTSLGSMIRAALWLESKVGEGNVFTKNQLREAFPDVSQIDRRLRDLRAYDWQIDTRREDPSLRLEEQRYAKKGIEVWGPERAKAKPKASLTAAQRAKVMSDDNFLCRSCGVAAGDYYEDGVSTAQLDVARKQVKLVDGTTEVQLVTECNRCRIGGRGKVVDLGVVIRDVTALEPLERKIFVGWLKRDRRSFSALEKLWATFRALPEEARAEIKRDVLGSGEQPPGIGGRSTSTLW